MVDYNLKITNPTDKEEQIEAVIEEDTYKKLKELLALTDVSVDSVLFVALDNAVRQLNINNKPL